MKRKPDAMVAMVLLFCLGLVISGLSSLTVGSNNNHSQPVEYSVSRY